MKRKNRKIALYSGITAVITSVVTASIMFGMLRKAYKDLAFDFEDWIE